MTRVLAIGDRCSLEEVGHRLDFIGCSFVGTCIERAVELLRSQRFDLVIIARGANGEASARIRSEIHSLRPQHAIVCISADD